MYDTRPESEPLLDRLVSLCRRRGFVFPASDIYGGLAGCFDFGPLGVELKNNIKQCWWRAMTLHHENVEGAETSVLMHPRVWEVFADTPAGTGRDAECRRCRVRFDAADPRRPRCPQCGGLAALVRPAPGVFRTVLGPHEASGLPLYLRPETTAGAVVNFQNVLLASRQKLPFGVAQIGKVFRNDGPDAGFLLPAREFEQMEMVFFVHPLEAQAWFERWQDERLAWLASLGLRPENLRVRAQDAGDAGRPVRAADLEYAFPTGWRPLETVRDRGDGDVGRHQQAAGKRLAYFDEARRAHYLPAVIATTAACEGVLLAVLADAYREEPAGEDARIVLCLAPHLAPVKAALLPLVRKDGLPEYAANLARDLRRAFRVVYDDAASVGRRYRRQDEIGTPYCITVDATTLQDGTVTVRDRDTMLQERVAASALRGWLDEKVRCA